MKQILTRLFLLITALSMIGCASKTAEAPAESTEPLPSEIPEPSVKEEETTETEDPANPAKLLYIGHASLRIITPEDKVIYIDPYAPGDYSLDADLVLVTHDHYDHSAVNLIEKRADGFTLITSQEAITNGEHQSFDLPYASVKAVQAGNNPNHSIDSCVGYVITLSDGVTIYISGDTSKTDQMTDLKNEGIDYAFFCCDGVYNMGAKEAAECAALVGAKHSIPYHVIPANDVYFSREKAEAFESETSMILEPGEEIELES